MINLLWLCVVIVLIYCLNYHIAWRKTPKCTEKRNGENIKRKSILRRLLVDLPMQNARDRARRNPNRFPEQGVILFQGRQGAGKTISMIQYATELKRKYNDLYICGNMKYKYSQKTLKSGTDMLKISKGETGALILLDEVQIWYNSKNSKNIDESVTCYLTTCRKNVRLILGTCQNYYMCSKDLRSQTKLLCDCRTAGALTVVVKKEPVLDSMGELKKMKFKGIYFFVHDDELRSLYDTSEMINILAKNGLKSREERGDYEIKHSQ